MGTRYRTNHNAFNSWNASSTRKHDGFQCGMCDNILSFNGFNHSIKSWIVYLFVMIQAKRTPVWWSSNPIKVNRWNFMSFVPNVASIEWHHCDHMITWTHIELVFEYLWWMGLESHWFHQHLAKKTHLLNVGKPKTKLKLQGWCVNTNSLSYVFNPNMECLGAKWNHLVSCFHLHSHVLTKLFYVCHIFVWSCSVT
jgi:hypothetical protein